MRTPHGIALKMFMGYVLHFVHISSSGPTQKYAFQIDILTLCKLVAHSIPMSSSFCINEHLKKSLSEAQRQTTETQQIAQQKNKAGTAMGYIEPGYHILEWWVRKIDNNPFEP